MRWRVCVLTLLTAGLASAAVIDDFEQPGGWAVHQGAERGGQFATVAAPVPRGLSGAVTWRVPHHAYLELHTSQPRPLPVFDRQLKGTVGVWVATDHPTALRSLSLRLIDHKGEVFQFRSRTELTDTAWRLVTFDVRPDTVSDSWGVKKTGTVELPVRLLGFAFDFTPAATEPGKIWFDDLTASAPGREVVTRRPLWRFDDHESWQVNGQFRTVASLQREPGGLVLTGAPVRTETPIPLTERSFGAQPLDAATAIVVRVELLSGRAARMALRLRDARGELHTYGGRTLGLGVNELVWRLPEDELRGPPVTGVLRPAELIYVQSPGTEMVRLRLLQADVVGRRPLLEALQVEVETGNPVHVLKVGDESKLALKVTNSSTEEVQVKAHVELEDFGGQRQPADLRLSLPAAGVLYAALPQPPRGLGIYWVDYTLTEPQGEGEVHGRRSFCHVQPAGPTPGRATGFLFSICTHTERWPQPDQDKEILAAGLCGAKVIRTGEGWGGIQPTAERWQWDKLDSLVQRYGDQGMELQYLLGFTPQWAAPAEFQKQHWLIWSRKQPRLDAWRAYCQAVARRYGDRIRYWEVWNEPDIDFWKGSLDEYLQLLQTAYEAIKGVDPKLQVMTGGFALYDRNPSFVEGVVARGQASFDILAWHRHGDFAGFRREVDGPLARLRAKLQPAKPIYFNETAIASVGIGERAQAETMLKKMTYAWSRGSLGYTWYDLRNDGFDPKDHEHNYGMLTHDFYPKAVYPAYNAAVNLLRDKQFSGALELGAERYGLVFSGPTEQVVVAWSDAAAGTVKLTTDAAAAQVADLMGNRRPTGLAGGQVELPLGRGPAYLVLPGAKAVPQVVVGPTGGR